MRREASATTTESFFVRAPRECPRCRCAFATTFADRQNFRLARLLGNRLASLFQSLQAGFGLFVVLLFLQSTGALAAGNSYTYDELGRLRSVISDTGEIAEYTYDAAGNIVGVRRIGSGTLAVTGFEPTNGPVGTIVRINGSGFATSAAANVVKFNGTSVTAASASANWLIVKVPPGATTGPVSVTVGGATVLSTGTFVVASGIANRQPAPTISGFAPSGGPAGTVVTVTGTRFEFTPDGTRVTLNQSLAQSTVIDANTLTFTVPPSTSSGRIRVTTSGGIAESAADFLVPPQGYTAGDIVSYARLDQGSSTSLSIGTANGVGVLLMDGLVGVYADIDVTSFSTTPAAAIVSYTVYSPDNRVFASGTIGGIGQIRLPRFTATGTYSVVVVPENATLNLTALVFTAPPIVIDGPGTTASLTIPGQSRRFVFNGTSGQHIGLGVVNGTIGTQGAGINATVFTPGGALIALVNASDSFGRGETELPVLIENGIYSVIVTSPENATGSSTLTLSTDVAAELVLGTPQNIEIGRAGQIARLTFNATAGQYVGFSVTGLSVTPSGEILGVTILTPDGNGFAGTTLAAPGGTLQIPVLPETGTYTVLLDPSNAATAVFTAKVDLADTLNLDGASTTANIASAGQTLRYTFNATAGQDIGLGIVNGTLTPADGASSIAVYDPQGLLLYSGGASGSGGRGDINLQGLPDTFTYLVTVDVPGGTGSANLTLSSDVTAALTLGTPYSLSITRPGQNAKLSFTGATGQYVSVQFTGITSTPAAAYLDVIVYSPTGAFVANEFIAAGSGGGTLHLPPLPESGTYSITIDPASGATVSGTVTAAFDAGLNLDGPSTTASIASAGQSLRYFFTAAAGQRLGLGMVTGTLNPPDANVYVDLTAPSGDQTLILAAGSNGRTGTDLTSLLSESGTYTTKVYLSQGTGSATLTLSSEITATLTLGSPYDLSIARPGQNARLSFNGVAGQTLRLSLGSGAVDPPGAYASVSILAPDGSPLTGDFFSGTAIDIDLPALPSTGTYTILVEPFGGATVTSTMVLTTQ